MNGLSGARFQRLSPSELFGRGVVAAVAGSLMTLGAYPFVPAALRARRRKESLARRLLTAELGREWSLAVASTLARPLGFVGLPGARARGPRPVILAHGYAMGRSCFIPMAVKLGRAGLGPSVGFEYWSLGSVASSARRLGRMIERVREASGADQVDIVGHSMGGVVARYFVNLEGGGDVVRHLITLGSPHRGSEATYLGAGQMRRELKPGSATLERLATSTTPDGVDLTCIYSPIDVLVGSSRHSKIDGADVIRFDDIGHMALLTDSRVFDIIRARLAG